ncbi:MAG: zinc ribbon domain-containing protein [Firmicutes bacterium]|nr:zinc ribbon domain-containing protein [Bacillota bacterium]
MSNFWDDFKDGASRFAKKAIDKTTTAVDITKLNLAKSDTEGKISKLYTKIGEIIYNRYKEGNEFDSDISEVFVEIDKFKAELDEICEQISSLKNTVACQGCGQQNPKGSQFCSKCGEKLSAEEEANEEDAASVDVVTEEE